MRWGYQKFVRRANDWAIVGVAAYDGRVALASMGGTPLRALATEEALRSGASIAEAAALAAEGTSPGYDFHADADYREHLARVLTRRALEGQTGLTPTGEAEHSQVAVLRRGGAGCGWSRRCSACSRSCARSSSSTRSSSPR